MQSEAVREAMAAQELSYRDLGFLTGLDPGYLCHIVKGERLASRQAALRIAKALRIPPEAVPSKPLPSAVLS